MSAKSELFEHNEFVSLIKPYFDIQEEETHEILFVDEIDEIAKFINPKEGLVSFEEIEDQIQCNRLAALLHFFNTIEDPEEKSPIEKRCLPSMPIKSDTRLLLHVHLDWMDIEIVYDEKTQFVLLNSAIVCKIDDPEYLHVEYKFDYIHQNHHVTVNTTKFFLFDKRMICIVTHNSRYEILASNRFDDCLLLELYHDDLDRNFFEIIGLKRNVKLSISRPRFCVHHITQEYIVFEEWQPDTVSICGEIIQYKKYAMYTPRFRGAYIFQVRIDPYRTKCDRCLDDTGRH
jgi:hypothetical protein